MTDDHEPSPAARPNPFPPGASAMLGELPDEVAGLDTRAILTARHVVDEYLARNLRPWRDTRARPGPAPDPRALTDDEAVRASSTGASGEVIAVFGEAGTGKTHLLNTLIHRLRHPAPGAAIPRKIVYLSAQASDFGTLYRTSFIPRFHPDELKSVVLGYYADVVAERLRTDFPQLAEQARALERRDPSVDPRTLARQTGLAARVPRQLQERLWQVTGSKQFGTAFALLADAQLALAVMDWLAGGVPPDARLQEQGVTGELSSDAQMLDCMGALTSLYGRQGLHFALLVDDIERLLGRPDQPATDTPKSFHKLLRTFVESGALLVLGGLPEYVDQIPGEVRSRIRTLISPSPLDGEQIAEYVRRRQGGVLDPFEQSACDAIHRLTGGRPRQVVRLCYRSFQLTEPPAKVDVPAVHEAARRENLGYVASLDDIRSQVSEILTGRGWAAETRHPLRPGGERPDFWIPMPTGQDAAGCAIVVSGRLVLPKDAEPLIGRVETLRRGNPERRVVVVTGFLSEEIRPSLTRACGAPPIVYAADRFHEVLTSRLDELNREILGRRPGPGPAADGDIALMRDSVDRIRRQVTASHDRVLDLQNQVELIRRHTDRQLQAIKSDLAHLPAAAGEEPEDPGRELPEAVVRLFTMALDSLAAIDDVDAYIGRAFDLSRDDAATTGAMLNYRLRRYEIFEAIGVSMVLRRLVTSFERSVASWLADVRSRSGPGSGPAADDRARLDKLCEAFDASYDAVPLSSLSQLDALSDDAVPGLSGSVAQVAIAESLDGLSGRVRHNVLSAAETMDRDPGPPPL
ncbi:ATP-binding protein [Actinomadura decatromicini]|uniref:ATP-binding protein n=1 Tax=Actinomadura decatromicini TaxID=2604572 RepID=UPI001652F242|nr:ATP-binding protein [Actinomadura decatromicini]